MRKQQIKAAISATVLGVLSPLAMVVPASAATEIYWDGGSYVSPDGKFNTSSNWVGNVVPTTGDIAVFTAESKYDYGSATVRSIDNDVSSLSLARIVFDGDVSLSSTSFELSGNSITITDGIFATMTGNGGDQQVKNSVTLGADATFKTTGSNTLSVGDTDTILDLSTHKLTLTGDGGTITLMGKIKGSGDITSTGKVKIMATPHSSGYTGTTTVSSGEFDANGQVGKINLTGGTLKGSGTVGDVTMSAGVVAPGNSPGVLNTGSLTYTGGSFDVELGGTADGEYDQTNVTGSVDLGSATDLDISLVNSFAPALKDSFTIINNDGTDTVSGTFKGLKEGEKVYGTYTYQVSYKGGDGNDVTLTVTGTPAAPDTGTGSVISSPYATLIAAILVASIVAGYRYLEVKKSKN
ncbi:hypothetical protein KC960_01200 [Candidatus Saccharibacteria bacterium]|nr:hypothetical protein [Candidatus Saccharibacteria bacterium]